MNIAIVLAAGKSERLKDINVPKQLYILNNVPLFMYGVLKFSNYENIDALYIVTNEECLDKIKQYVAQYNLKKVRAVLLGGNSRQQSVYLALQRLAKDGVKDDDIILIHDAARPIVDKQVLIDSIQGVLDHDAVTPVIKVNDTIIKGDNTLDTFVNRDGLYRVQTPQSFRFKIIKEAHEKALKENKEYTDDSALVKENGQPVYLIKGSAASFKVTTIDDLKLLEMIVL